MIYRRYVKQVLDAFLALILLIVFSPLMLITGVLIYVKIGRPILFKQIRPGKNETLFTIYKFRTMTNQRDKEGNLLPDKIRLTSVGLWIRKLSLDELPQLFNVLKGDMSFVGPRPLLVEYLSLYNNEQKKRHDVKPGITGWAQVNGRNSISWEDKFKYDIWYMEHQSFLLDMKILWMTVKKVLHKSDVHSKTSVSMEKFEGSE